ncbi:MAG: phospho-N-acetylmuramoyl-pentapeptide-transferase [Alphaproteobacteria bacterium]|nr:phospho-N-acetylmuramoyl-pentapeptide-transferase [Alphaproteobacteria bacterium]
MFNSLFQSAANELPVFSSTLCWRAGGAFFTSFILVLLFGERIITFLRHHQGKGQPIREDGPQSHLLTKKGTPTMGGLMILGGGILSTILWTHWNDPLVWVCILVLLVYGFVGFVDDYVKVKKQTANAMTAKMKLLLQFSTALISVLIISYLTPEQNRFSLTIPYFKNLAVNLWLFYIPFAMIVIVGASNAVNLSDGLDGLASGLMIAALFVFMVFAYIGGSPLVDVFAVAKLPNVGEVAVVCAAVIGGCLGFLWFNCAPAKVFMGDTGSLALGGLLGTIAVMLKQEIILAIAGGIFVIEALSVMIQVAYFKRTGGKRFFKMAPIHHHFEQSGWPETRVVNRFWIAALILAVVALMSLSVR